MRKSRQKASEKHIQLSGTRLLISWIFFRKCLYMKPYRAQEVSVSNGRPGWTKRSVHTQTAGRKWWNHVCEFSENHEEPLGPVEPPCRVHWSWNQQRQGSSLVAILEISRGAAGRVESWSQELFPIPGAFQWPLMDFRDKTWRCLGKRKSLLCPLLSLQWKLIFFYAFTENHSTYSKTPPSGVCNLMILLYPQIWATLISSTVRKVRYPRTRPHVC